MSPKAVAYFSGGFAATLLAFLVYTHRPDVISLAVADSKSSDIAAMRKSSESFRAVAKMVGPAVVTIKSTLGTPKQPRRGNPFGRGGRAMPPPQGGEDEEGGAPLEDPFFDFFRRFGQPQPGPQEPQTSLGSGFVIDKRGYIVTNNHVVENASKIVVNMPGDETTDVPAKVVGTDPRTDLAVLKLTTGKDLPIADWADSDAVEVGDWALAIGSPFMLSHSVTLGIVSAKGRNASSLMGADYGYEMLQTDAAINPGNSGGPLCGIDGKVMGVNTAIFTRSGGYMGIGFAIPSKLAREIADTLIKGGKVIRGWLGVAIQPIDEAMAKELGVKDGVLVHQVTPSSPAEKAGLKAGDIILEVAGKPAHEVSQVQQMVSAHKPGDKLAIKLMGYNDKKTRSIEVKIGELPAKETGETREAEPEESAADELGLALSNSSSGVVVDRVEQGSPAEQMGLQKGDKLVSINRTKIKTVAEYKKLIKASKRFNLLVNRKGQQLFFRMTIPE